MVFSRLKGRIRECGFADKDIARLLGLTPQTFSSKLNGKADWNVSEMWKICEILNIPVTDMHEFFALSHENGG